jgi:hypothetical protein
LGDDTLQFCRPLHSVAFPEGVFGDRMLAVHREHPGDAHVEGSLRVLFP